MTVTEPGVYQLDEQDYHCDPVEGGSLSQSGAKVLLDSPAKFDHQRRNGRKAKKAWDVGTAAHREVLGDGPELVVPKNAEGQPYARWDSTDAKAQVAEIRASGNVPLKQDELDTVRAMAKALRAYPVAQALLDPDAGRVEQSLFHRDPETGVWMRMRADYLEGTSDQRLILVDYKGLSLDTPLPTPTGWTTVRAVQVGDDLLDGDGAPCRVTGKSAVHQRVCYRMTFDDGSSVICDDEHLWVTSSGRNSGRQRQSVAVRSTEEIRKTLRLHGQTHHRVAIAGPLDLPEADLLVDPYVLGCWLGDGTRDHGRITSGDPEIFERIEARGYRLGIVNPRTLTRTVLGLVGPLRALGVLGSKSVPELYLRGSAQQRLDLLRGLMDTDGSWNAARHQAVFTNRDKALALSVQELALSLGQRAVFHTYQAKGFGLMVEAYRVTFTPTGGLNPFALRRKAEAVERGDWDQMKSLRRVVKSVTEVPSVPTQCLQVDSPSSTFLCTEWMIPTHNTTTDASDEGVSRSVENFRYHLQDDWYRHVVREVLGLDHDPLMFFIFQETEPPYLVNVVQLDETFRRGGEALRRQALHLYAACTASGTWPGYDQEISTVSPPAWARGRYPREVFA